MGVFGVAVEVAVRSYREVSLWGEQSTYLYLGKGQGKGSEPCTPTTQHEFCRSGMGTMTLLRTEGTKAHSHWTSCFLSRYHCGPPLRNVHCPQNPILGTTNWARALELLGW